MRVKAVLILLMFISGSLKATEKLGDDFFNRTDQFLKKYVKNGLVNYPELKNNTELSDLIKTIETTDLSDASANEKKAFYINAYNLIVVNSVNESYPLASVKEVGGFFDGKKHVIAGKKTTLNDLEKKDLIKAYDDARFHFVLVCGALGCPPITNFAYTPEKVDEQMERQTKKAMNNTQFLQIDDGAKKANLSEIFKWYASDFGGSKKSVYAYINKYRSTKITDDYSLGYYDYDWSLNALNNNNTVEGGDGESSQGTNASRYVVSAAIPKGNHELKLFNNLYSETRGSEEDGNGTRSTFFTSSFSYLYGLNSRFNIGGEVRFRRVSNTTLPSSVLGFDVFKGDGDENRNTRTGVTGIGPKIRWAPFKKLSHFSLQSTLLLTFEDDQEGIDDEPFIDFNNATWITQFFYDFDIGNSFSLFTEVDFSIEDIGKRNRSGGFGPDGGAVNRLSTPLTVIFSYFPNPKTTFYALTNYGPQFNKDLVNGWNYEYFYQVGTGFKYQVTKKFELEFLYTFFRSEGLVAEGVNGKANTVNFGIRQSF